MFGHLKNAEFIEIIEDEGRTSAEQKAHLDSCAACTSTLKAASATYMKFAETAGEVPDLDWEEFRSSVRDGLLSHSIQRQSALRRWIGWLAPSSPAWTVSFALAAVFAVSGLLWHVELDRRASAENAAASNMLPALYIDTDAATADSELSSWSHSDAFVSMADMSEEQATEMRTIMQSALSTQQGAVERQ